MNTLRDYVEWGMTHCDKTASAEGVPLVMENCVKNKKMKQLEVYGNSVQNGTPTPEAPVEVESVGEKCTKNLYDAESYPLVYGHYIHPIGVYEPSASYCATPDYIPCVELRGKTITIGHTGGTNPSVAFYDAEKTFISSVKNNGGVKITAVVPDNASYYRFCVKAEYSDVAQVELGDTATEYEPYGKYKIPVTVRGKNVFNCKNSKSLYNGYVSGSMGIIRTESDIMWTASANASSSVHMDMGLLSQYVGKQLTLSFEIDLVNGESVGSTRFVICTEKGEERSAVNGSVSKKNGRYFVTSTIPNRNENDHLSLRLYVSDAKSATTYTFKNVMVSVMPGDVEFEPYVEPVTTNVYLNEPLRKIGNYADYIDFKGKKVVRTISHTEINGDTSLIVGKSSNEYGYSLYLYQKNDMVNDYANASLLCSEWQCKNVYVTRNEQYICIVSISRIGFVTTHSSLDEFKVFLKEHPTTVYYPLIQPYEEPIECNLPVLTAKTTIVDIETSLLPSNIKGKYIKR